MRSYKGIRWLTAEKAHQIVNSPYLHAKYYGVLDHEPISNYLDKMDGAKESAREELVSIIEQQERREHQKLDSIFNMELDEEYLYRNYEAGRVGEFIYAYNRVRDSRDIQDRVDGLNALLKIDVPAKQAESNQEALEAAAEVIQSAFDENNMAAREFKNVTTARTFIRTLYRSIQAIDRAKADIDNIYVEAALQAVVKRLNREMTGYLARYEKFRKRDSKRERAMTKTIGKIQQFIGQRGKARRSSRVMDTEDRVKVGLEKSMKGALKQMGGKQWEQAVVDSMTDKVAEMMVNAFDGMSLSAGGSVIQSMDKKTRRMQKADISLTFRMTADEGTESQVDLTFSVKTTSDDSPNVSFHNGGSLFAHSRRLESLNFGGAENPFSFLQDGAFQYLYVNEMVHGNAGARMYEHFVDMLKGAGFAFLGQETEGHSGADFFHVNGEIYRFSLVLRHVLRNEDLIQVRVDLENRPTLNQKLALVQGPWLEGEMYSQKFIDQSIKIGRSTIYAAKYGLDLDKSALTF